MNPLFIRPRFLIAAALLFLAAQQLSLAGSATWSSNPISGDWNTGANWVPRTVPNSTTDTATFGASDVTEVTNSDVIINLDSLVFSPGASQYTITAMDNIAFYGTGIVNGSGVMQSFVAGLFIFNNSSTAGDIVSFTTVGGNFFFNNTSSAGSATFALTDGDLQAHMFFNDDSTAGNATINASASSEISFFDSSTGGNATLNLSTAAFASFAESNDAEHMNGNCVGGAGQFSSQIDFEGSSDAGDGTFTAVGGSTSGEAGAFILLDSIATADSATFIINGGMGAGLTGTELFFMDTATAANANITANGGVGGSNGGAVVFTNGSKGGKASITLNGNATVDITMHNAPGVTIGSLAGNGPVLLGANTLTIGSNNQSTTFSGVIQDNGGLTKAGTGTLTLSGSNLYTGNTTVTGGMLQVSNRRGSGTGTGSVNVQAGTLAGKGIISGAVTIGTGSGSGAFLAPAAGSNVPATLTTQSTVTFNADATYVYTFKAKRNTARTDMVVADGITINSGAMIALSGQTQGRLTTGLTLTLIRNTSANPISGTFANLPDGGIVTVNGNHLQASYSGGDGNDLTLMVVP
jgi:autotransporter-associated beta strand protein